MVRLVSTRLNGHLFRSLQRNWQQGDDREDVLHGVDHLREGQDAEAEGRIVVALDDQLSLQEDQC